MNKRIAILVLGLFYIVNGAACGSAFFKGSYGVAIFCAFNELYVLATLIAVFQTHMSEELKQFREWFYHEEHKNIVLKSEVVKLKEELFAANEKIRSLTAP